MMRNKATAKGIQSILNKNAEKNTFQAFGRIPYGPGGNADGPRPPYIRDMYSGPERRDTA
jgi:hypothetical protein